MNSKMIIQAKILKKGTLLILLFISVSTLLGQDRPIENITLEKNINESNNLNIGTMEFSIPLYSYDVGRLKLQQNISYQANGFYPNISPSEIGLNWDINALGKITRSPGKTRDLSLTALASTPAGVDLSQQMDYQDKLLPYTNILDKSDLYNNPLANRSNIYNFDPDKFYFNFFGHSGYFTFDNEQKPLFFCQTGNLKLITFDTNPHSFFKLIDSSQIVLGDDKGNIFYFGGNPNSLDINFTETNYYNSNIVYPPTGFPSSSVARKIRTNYIISWNLKKVILADGTEITATYEDEDQSVLQKYIEEGNKALKTNNFTNQFPQKQSLLSANLDIVKSDNSTSSSLSVPVGTGGISSSSTQVSTAVYTKKAMIKNIMFANNTIEFYYTPTKNNLELSQKYLDQIVVKNAYSVVKRIKLNHHDYGKTYTRTFLTGLSFNDLENYHFNYLKTTDFPAYEKSVNIMDVWNGVVSQTEIPYTADQVYDVGMLSEVILPTRGKIKYFYEPHSSNFTFTKNNQSEDYTYTEDLKNNLPAPRLKKIIEANADDTPVNTKEYFYVNDQAKSSGIIDLSLGEIFTVSPNIGGGGMTVTNIAGSEVYNRARVHYSLVKEVTSGRGYKKIFFTDRFSNPDSLCVKFYNPSYSGVLWNKPFPLSKDYERGKISKVQQYDAEDNIQVEEIYNYTSFLAKKAIEKVTDNCSTCRISDQNYYVYIYGNPNVFYAMYQPVTPYLPKSISTKTFPKNGFPIYSDKIFSYSRSPKFWHIDPIKIIDNDSNNQTEKDFYYPNELIKINNNCLTSNCILTNTQEVGGKKNTYQKMLDKNIITPILTISKTGKKKNSLIENVYLQSTTNPQLFLLRKVNKSLLDSNFDDSNFSTAKTYTETDLDLYDSKGNTLQSRLKDGKATSYIWGYNQTQLIAKIEGATYQQLMEAFGISPIDSDSYLSLDIVKKSDIDVDDTSEQSLLAALNDFRKKDEFKNYPITTYTYDPLMGVTSVTPPSGIRESYHYDASNRLDKIVDVNGNILKSYKYNYAAEKFYSQQISRDFYRNNCGNNALTSSYTYTIPAGKYSSIISQADADAQAQNDINTNGQNVANSFGICTPFSCSLSLGFPGGGSVSASGTYFRVSFGFYTGANSTNLPWKTGVKVGTITGTCRPTKDYSWYNGRIYYTITSSGDIILKTGGESLPNNTSYSYELIFQ